jgi:hypothetical protein
MHCMATIELCGNHLKELGGIIGSPFAEVNSWNKATGKRRCGIAESKPPRDIL